VGLEVRYLLLDYKFSVVFYAGFCAAPQKKKTDFNANWVLGSKISKKKYNLQK